MPVAKVVDLAARRRSKKTHAEQLRTREEWLHKVANGLRPTFAALEYPLPESIRIAIGFPSTGRRGHRIGEAWTAERSKDNHFELFIRPDQDDPIEVAATLAHELTHAAVGLRAMHGRKFREVAVGVGLIGPMRATRPGEKFIQLIRPILEMAGPLPHAKLDFENMRSSGPPKQTNRSVRCICETCGYVVRTTRIWLLGPGFPRCPDGDFMVLHPEEDASFLEAEDE